MLCLRLQTGEGSKRDARGHGLCVCMGDRGRGIGTYRPAAELEVNYSPYLERRAVRANSQT
jgi:hypothetical protein